MNKQILMTIELVFDDDQFNEFLEYQEITEDQLSDWVFGELCQNQGMGFLVGLRKEPYSDED